MNTDELEWSLKLNDFELSLIRDTLSNGSTPIDQALAVFSATNVEFSNISTVLPQHQANPPENLTSFLAMDGTLPAVPEATDVAPNSDITAWKCNEMVSGAKEGIRPSMPGRRYRGVSQRGSGRFSAEINVRNPGKKSTRLWLGTYDTAEEAAMAFDRAAFKARGSNAVLNFPDLVGTYNVSPEKDTSKKLSTRSEGSPSSLSLESSRNNPLKRKSTAL